MKVKLHPADQGGCRFYRLAEPARAVEMEGVECYLDPQIPLEVSDRTRASRLAPVDADVLVFQRPAKRSVVERMPEYQKRGYAVVVDIDDDFDVLPTKHPGRYYFTGGDDDVNVRYLRQACAQADMVTCTTEALADRYGSHGRVAVLPNCVPHALLEMDTVDRKNTVGWAGATDYHPDDLEATRGAVQQMLERYGWEFLLVGDDAETVQKRLALAETPECTGWLSIEEYHDAIGKFGIGIVPLANSTFNSAKSALKGLEMAARGVPFVASDVADYRRIEAEGIGICARERSRNWMQAFKRCIDEGTQMAEHAQEVIAERHTYETQGYRWAEAWEAALERRKAIVPTRWQPKAAARRPEAQPGSSKVTVLMTVYNAAEHLQQAIESVLYQTHTDLELLILEDGSTEDKVDEILEAQTDQRVRIFRFHPSEEERRATCRYATLINEGALRSDAPYITYLCGDDYYMPDRLERMVAKLQQGYDVVYGEQALYREGRRFSTRLARGTLDDAFEQVDLNSVMHTRASFARVQGWPTDPSLWRNADAHFWRRLNNAGYVFVPVGGGVTDAKRYRAQGVDERVIGGLTPWIEETGVAA